MKLPGNLHALERLHAWLGVAAAALFLYIILKKGGPG